MKSTKDTKAYCPTCKKYVPLLLGVDYEDGLISVCAISKVEEVNKKLAEYCDYNTKSYIKLGLG
jgi:hypothetical protein